MLWWELVRKVLVADWDVDLGGKRFEQFLCVANGSIGLQEERETMARKCLLWCLSTVLFISLQTFTTSLLAVLRWGLDAGWPLTSHRRHGPLVYRLVLFLRTKCSVFIPRGILLSQLCISFHQNLGFSRTRNNCAEVSIFKSYLIKAIIFPKLMN